MLQKMLEGNGANDLVQQYLKGDVSLDDTIDEVIQALLSAFQ